jgi:UDP-glucose-4-epimerase GalE
MRVMVTGGAGYIGSVIAARLLAAGYTVVVYDNLYRGHRAAVPAGAGLVVGDIRAADDLEAALRDHRCDAVVHMAALAEVGESVCEPDLYREVNLDGTETLIAAARAAGVSRIVFSSTAAVYGAPERMPIDEDAATAPTNPYGETKLAAERALFAAAAASGGRLSAVAVRYFNAAGADGTRGEDHEPETHLVPLALRAARDGTTLSVFGDDYPTADGTCVRDYVHVRDLAEAHVAALERLPGAAGVYNLGTGDGNSVLDVVTTAERVTGNAIARTVTPRRAGDPPVLVASHGRASRGLGWTPRRTLDTIVADAWAWLRTHPEGYGERT